jgi:hypothetical protein
VTVEPLRPASCRREALFADPLLRGELLLIALVWDHLLDTTPGELIRLKHTARMAGLPYREVLRRLVYDIPRYDPPDKPEHCQYVGPRGGTCPRRGQVHRELRDPDDGTITWVSGCYNRDHRAWAERKAALHDEQLGARTPPKPAYNTRSRMAHHFEDVLDFPSWWIKLGTENAKRRFGICYPINPDAVYDVSRDPERGGQSLIQRPRLRIVS